MINLMLTKALQKNGGVAEWLKAAVLKTVECNSSVGSNPTSSANPKKMSDVEKWPRG